MLSFLKNIIKVLSVLVFGQRNPAEWLCLILVNRFHFKGDDPDSQIVIFMKYPGFLQKDILIL